MIGFAVLMFGMTMMSDAVKPLANDPEFANLLLMFSNPVLGVLAGALLTAIIQSSSASVGILQALSVTGTITFGSAIPIIIGQNIGTCVTALLSCIGATKNAKRAAMVHLYFNVIGAVIFLVLFYAANAVFKFSFVTQSLNPADIAIVHTAFNLLSTAVLLPFSKQLGKLATLTIRDKKEPEKVPILDERFFSAPSLAIEVCKSTTVQMANVARDSMQAAIAVNRQYDEALVKKVLESEETVDTYEDAIGTYLVKLSGKELTVHDSRESSKILHVIGDLERISDHAVNLLEVAQELHTKRIVLSEHARADLAIMSDAVTEILDLAIDAFTHDDLTMAAKVEPLEEVIDDLKAELKNRHIARLQEGACTIELGFIFSDLITNYERVSDHCSNIAVSLIQTREDHYDAHEYLHHLKDEEGNEFVEAYEADKLRYHLPDEEDEPEAPPRTEA